MILKPMEPIPDWVDMRKPEITPEVILPGVNGGDDVPAFLILEKNTVTVVYSDDPRGTDDVACWKTFRTMREARLFVENCPGGRLCVETLKALRFRCFDMSGMKIVAYPPPAE